GRCPLIVVHCPWVARCGSRIARRSIPALRSPLSARRPEHPLQQSFAHSEAPCFVRGRLRAKEVLGALVVPAVDGTGALGELDEGFQRFSPFFRVVPRHGRKCTMRDRFDMPLPKSILCTACKRTYPEGWRRCPYCGHDELRSRMDASARKYMARKVQEFEQK